MEPTVPELDKINERVNSPAQVEVNIITTNPRARIAKDSRDLKGIRIFPFSRVSRWVMNKFEI